MWATEQFAASLRASKESKDFILEYTVRKRVLLHILPGFFLSALFS